MGLLEANLWVGLAISILIIVGCAVWLLGKSGDPNTRDEFGQVIKPPKPSRHDELIEARDRIKRQLEILQTPIRSGDYTQLSRQNIEKLRAVLKGIEAELGDQN